MPDQVAIAVDAMSGDEGPSVAVSAVLDFLEHHKASKVFLVGDRDALEALLLSEQTTRSNLAVLRQGLEIIHSEAVVTMEDKPSLVLRRKPNSSMAIAMSLVRDDRAQACVSAGNTGALMILGRSMLGMFPGIERPAITKMFPSQGGGTLVLDLGANVDSSAEHLMQFALMGQLLAEVIKRKPKATVALLNVGEESIKGTEQVRLAETLIQDSAAINYIGYAEGGDIFRAKADVLVCDGFVGNVALKSAEGAAKIILNGVKEFFEKNWYSRLLSRLLLPLMGTALKNLDPQTHNGAMFLGLNGVVVKSHGCANSESFAHAIELAEQEARAELPALINQALEEIL